MPLQLNQNRQSSGSQHERLDAVINASLREIANSRQNGRVQLVPSQALLPTLETLQGVIEGLQAVLFPELFASGRSRSDLAGQLRLSLGQLGLEMHRAFSAAVADEKTDELDANISSLLANLGRALPELRDELLSDAQAMYAADPSSSSVLEVLVAAPGFRALLHHRIAHQLHESGVPLLPRMISFLAQRETGIDIHPAARIGRGMCIDHGTGIVIGETAVIGSYARIYQGVTLGARSIPLDESGRARRGLQRHPRLGDNVTVYSGASILGPVTIGDDSVIGGNVWLTSSVPQGSRVLQHAPVQEPFQQGGGI
jgi:serine O-acetyltransferase